MVDIWSNEECEAGSELPASILSGYGPIQGGEILALFSPKVIVVGGDEELQGRCNQNLHGYFCVFLHSLQSLHDPPFYGNV